MKYILFSLFICLLFNCFALAQDRSVFQPTFVAPCIFKGVRGLDGELKIVAINTQKIHNNLSSPLQGADKYVHQSGVLGVCYAVTINYSEKVDYCSATILSDFTSEKEKELLKKLFIYYNQQCILLLKQSTILLKSVQDPSDWEKSQSSALLVEYLNQHRMWMLAESSIPFYIRYQFMKELEDTVIKESAQASADYDEEWKRLGSPSLK